MVVDTSAVVAIARNEPDARRFAEALAITPGKRIAAPTFLECAFVLGGLAPTKGIVFLKGLVADTLIAIEPFGPELLDAAVEARQKFGRGSGHPAKLNFGDCFSYALARTLSLPLLFKGDDFIHTDIEPALKPA